MNIRWLSRAWILVLALSSPMVADASADWLIAQGRLDGAIATTADVAIDLQSTSEAVKALRLVGRSDAVAAADAYVAGYSYNGTEFLSRKIVVGAAAGQTTAALVAELFSRQNVDGGFGEWPGYDSNAIDTAFALEALTASNNASGTQAGFAVGYLLQRQAANGAWIGTDNSPSVYATALALRSIWPFRTRFNVAQQVASARNWLLSQRAPSGLWAEPHLSALTLASVLPTIADRSPIAASVEALALLARADGSIGGDVYTTALALQVSSLAQAPFPDRIVLTGRVIDGDTSAALSGAQVVISGPTSATISTDVDGRFRFESAAAGTYSFAVSAPTYSPITATTTVRAGQIADFGDISLLRGVVPTSAVLRGRVTDDLTGLAIAGALVELAGPALSVVTGADGQYQIAGIPVGAATITISRDGYATVQGSANFTAGQIYNFSPQLRVAASAFVVLEGTVIEVGTSLPLAGVAITATIEGNSTTATTGADGSYRIENLPAGSLTASASLDGFYDASGSTNTTAGTRVNFSPALTRMTEPQPPPPVAGEIVGVVVDSVSGVQVSGASVQFVVGSTTRSATTDSDGRFRILNAVGAGELRLSRSSYRALTIPLSVGAGTIVDMESIEFVPTSLANGGAFRGVVLDALTNAPRSGVLVTAVFGATTRTATTSSTGAFQITGINPLEGSARLTRTGYETLDMGLSLSLGEIVDLGTIYVRPVNTDEVRGDLIVQTLDISAVSTNATDFHVSGAIQVGIQNSGVAQLAGSINVKAFADLNRNGSFDSAGDTDLGNTFIDIDLAPSAVQPVTVALAGTSAFRDAPIFVWVDSDNTLIEQSEANNVDSSAGICGSAQRLAVDLGLCMDSSGSISSANFQLQLQGTASAVENPAIVPHDGSVRLTVMQFDSSTRVEVPPTILDATNAATLAARIRAIRKSNGGTAIHSCINTATQQLSNALPRAAVRVIDLATDGGSNLQQAVQASANAEAAGIDALNALAVGSGADLNVLNAVVFPRTTGPDAGFVVEIDTFEEYADAIATKIRREARTADLTLGGLRIIDEGTSVTLSVRAGNGGSRTVPGGVVVAFYAGEPTGGGQLLGQFTLPQLTTGEYVDVSLPGVTALAGGESVVAIADEAALVGECNTGNNRTSTASGVLRGALSVSTDAAIYAPSTPVSLFANVTNLGALAGAFRYQLQIEDAAGQTVEAFPARETDMIVGGLSVSTAEPWNTRLLLAGTYTLRGALTLLDGTPVTVATATFTIRHDPSSSPEAALRVSTDRAIYNTSDSATVEALARNLTQSTLMQGTQVRLTVTAPSGTIVMDRTLVSGDLSGGNARELSTPLGLASAEEGVYSVAGSLIDGEGALRASGTSTFRVEEDLRATLVGQVSVASPELLVGQAQICTSTVTNQGTLSLPSQALRHVVIRLADSTVTVHSDFTAALSPSASHIDTRSVTTVGYIPGDHACVLQARVNDEWIDLAYATFVLDQPPIQLESAMGVGSHGRVLILLDAPASADNTNDPFGPSAAPDLIVQRAHIESVLDEAGWSYTIVESAEDFEREFNTGGYEIYAVLSESEKLATALQRQVVDAIEAGAGLLVAGNHDSRNNKLEDALGIKSLGKNLDVTSLVLVPSPVNGIGGEEAFAITTPPQTIHLEGATAIGHYRLQKPKPNEAEPIAVTLHEFGEGRSVYAGFDLPLQGAAAGDESLFGRLLPQSFTAVHPEEIVPRVNGVVPIKLRLVNEGVPTSGRVLFTLPAGVTVVDPGAALAQPDGTFEWQYSLDAGELLDLVLWVKLPPQAGDITFHALIQVGAAPNYVDYGEQEHIVRVLAAN